MLFDTQSDPWCLNNLANDPAHTGRAATMLAELENLMLRDLDLGLWPEPERVAAENGHSAHLRAHRDMLYPLDRILSIAKLVGQGPQHRNTFTAALADSDSTVRYWAAIGLTALGGDIEPLRPLLKDSAASVRIIAAESLVRHDANPAALDLLATELDSRNEWAATRAARSLELLGEKARPKLDIMRDALKRRTSGFFGKEGAHIRVAGDRGLGTALDRLVSRRHQHRYRFRPSTALMAVSAWRPQVSGVEAVLPAASVPWKFGRVSQHSPRLRCGEDHREVEEREQRGNRRQQQGRHREQGDRRTAHPSRSPPCEASNRSPRHQALNLRRLS
jgi:hypothetical protein